MDDFLHSQSTIASGKYTRNDYVREITNRLNEKFQEIKKLKEDDKISLYYEMYFEEQFDSFKVML